MPFEDWDKRPNGDVAVHPFLGWETAVTPLAGLVRLQYAEDEAQFEAGGIGLQLTMTPIQLRSLSEALLRMADKIEAPHSGPMQ